MNRDKKQLVVVGVLVAVVLSVGAFQVMRKPEEAPVATTKKPVTGDGKGGEAAVKVAGPKYPELLPLAPRDPFLTAGFVAVGTTPTPAPIKPPGGTGIPAGPKGTLIDISKGPGFTGDLRGVPTPLVPAEPPKPVFGYTLVGIVNGAHPMAVFDDGKGNQQLVEVGQGIGPSATILTISRGSVRVKFNAETLEFNVGGNPNAK